MYRRDIVIRCRAAIINDARGAFSIAIARKTTRLSFSAPDFLFAHIPARFFFQMILVARDIMSGKQYANIQIFIATEWRKRPRATVADFCKVGKVYVLHFDKFHRSACRQRTNVQW